MCSRNQTLSADHSAMPSVHVCTSCICCAYSECKARVHFMRSLRLFRMQSTCALHAFLALDQNAKHMCTSIQYAKHVCTACIPCAYLKCKAHVHFDCVPCAYLDCKARVHFMRSLRLFKMQSTCALQFSMQSTCALHAFLALIQNAKHMCTSIQFAEHVCTSCVPCAYSKCKAHVHFNSVCKARVHFNCVPCASSVCVLIQYANRFYSTNSTVPVLQYRFYIAMYQKSLPYVHALFPPPPRNVN